jgi:hypothetical protein
MNTGKLSLETKGMSFCVNVFPGILYTKFEGKIEFMEKIRKL